MTTIAANLPSPSRNIRLGQQAMLAGLVLVEILVFSIIGTNFLTWRNFFQIPRINVELGLLALAMTPVIVTGGIDLSVGSLLGLCAVVFGKLWRDCAFRSGASSGGGGCAGGGGGGT